MAYKKKALTVDEYLHLKPTQVRSIAKNKTEMAKAVSTMRAVAVKRYEREVKVRTKSPAVYDLKQATKAKHEGVVTKETMFPSVRNMSLQQLQSEYNKYKSYLTDTTSTSKGLEIEFQRIRDNLGIGHIKMSQGTMTDFLDVWNAVRYRGNLNEDRYKYEEVMDAIVTELLDGADPDALIKKYKDKVDEYYAEKNDPNNPNNPPASSDEMWEFGKEDYEVKEHGGRYI